VRLDHLLSKELHLGSSGVARVTGRHEVAGARVAVFPAEDHGLASSGVRGCGCFFEYVEQSTVLTERRRTVGS
jgi:hypothetical protein